MSVRHSGLQKDVLALYRRALRMVRTKPENVQPKFSLFVRWSFRTQSAGVSPRNVSTIEHLLRKGARQLETYESPTVKDCWVSGEMKQWDEEQKHRWRTLHAHSTPQ
ncbi:uncharacterized protein STEHIDRAFT_58727 [Stereum hirsutum FP-91666 SS1]|uniref:uncharacterized protein n=1 Tax=Stereum hirsutum (strain FP-91666) TaxID=721885 RepID=UPI000444938C|nr:uncharacterized protein STEHIDRAFT_58727 [Stereum hirsutum FP-91666 SS1]EIM85801.1 hypothetical protein STEHIDRAFT_58727 [Stereum hirsutum FP-91666 SS1]